MPRKFLNGADLTNQRLINLADPTSATDAATRQWVEALVRGLSWKTAVRVATTTTGTLATAFQNGATVDGVTLVTGDRILVKDQSSGGENGIYTVNASGAPTRALDADSSAELAGAAVYVQLGTVNADRAYTQTVDTITLNTTALVWTQFGGGAAYTAGNGLSLGGGAFSVTASTGISVSGAGVAIDTSLVARKYAINVPNGSTTATITHNLGTLDVVVAVLLISTGEVVEADVIAATTNTVTLTFATAPTIGQYRAVVMG